MKPPERKRPFGQVFFAFYLQIPTKKLPTRKKGLFDLL